MMLFKLSLKNIRKSIRDYAVYFLTLILGVAIFYVFNAIGSQKAMLSLSASGYELVELMVSMLSMVSVVVAFILGFLIVYANRFLIKRRKREFGIYMMLGMGKGGISRILLYETVLVGLISLVVGLFLGVFASQFMSILVAKLFEADLSAYTFTVSGDAVKKTILNFAVMYVIVLLFNAVSVSRYKLIDLFTAGRKGERRILKHAGLSALVFFIGAAILAYAYYQVAYCSGSITRGRAALMIFLGCVGTFLVFWSMAGFLLKLLQCMKGCYFKNLNAFVIRQFCSNINTAVFSMTVICLLLFVTICAFCSGMSMNYALKKDLQEMTPVDLCMQKTMDLPEDGSFEETYVENSKKSVLEMLEELGFSKENLQTGFVEVSIYADSAITFRTTLGAFAQEVTAQFPMIMWDTAESIMSVSEYNRLAVLYGNPTYELEEDEYLILCDYDNMANLRNFSLADGTEITVGSHTLKPACAECQEGYAEMSNSHTNTGIILIPDEVLEAEKGISLTREVNLLAGNYAAQDEAGKQRTEDILLQIPEDEAKTFMGAGGTTKLDIYESSRGLAAIITFVVLYLGITFLISGAAILAIKSLSDTADSKGQYEILQKIGADEKMLHKALRSQLGLFFLLPLLVAVIHSCFGMRFISYMLSMFNRGDMLAGTGVTALLLFAVYAGYFAATYHTSKRIVEEKQR